MINVVFSLKHLEKIYLIILLEKNLLFVKLIVPNQPMEQFEGFIFKFHHQVNLSLFLFKVAKY